MPTSSRQPTRARAAPWLARNPAWGVAVMLIGAISFIALAVNVRTNGPLTTWDVPISNDLHTRAITSSEFVRKAVFFICTFGRETAGLFVALFGIYWLWSRQWRLLSMLLIGVLGGNTWFEVLSHFFQRPRPAFPDHLDPLPGPGFPSGHAMTAFMLYSLLTYLALPRLPMVWRPVAVGAAAVLVLLVGIGRLFLGNHYPTDILGGYTYGMFWGGLVYTTLEVYFHRRAERRAMAVPSIKA